MAEHGLVYYSMGQPDAVPEKRATRTLKLA